MLENFHLCYILYVIFWFFRNCLHPLMKGLRKVLPKEGLSIMAMSFAMKYMVLVLLVLWFDGWLGSVVTLVQDCRVEGSGGMNYIIQIEKRHAEADVARLKQKVAKRVTTIKYTITGKHGVRTTCSSCKSVPRASSCKSVEGFV